MSDDKHMGTYENVLNRNMCKTRSDVSGPVMMYSRHVHVRGNDQLVCIPLSVSLFLSLNLSLPPCPASCKKSPTHLNKELRITPNVLTAHNTYMSTAATANL